jgi:hypothetical protein
MNIEELLKEHEGRLTIKGAFPQRREWRYSNPDYHSKVIFPKGVLPATPDYLADTLFVKHYSNIYEHERFAFEVSECLGWHIIPEPFLITSWVNSRVRDTDKGIAWRWIQGAPPKYSRFKYSSAWDGAQARFAVLRALIGTGDAHYMNAIVNPRTKKVWSIDHQVTRVLVNNVFIVLGDTFNYERWDEDSVRGEIGVSLDHVEECLPKLKQIDADYFPRQLQELRRGLK